MEDIKSLDSGTRNMNSKIRIESMDTFAPKANSIRVKDGDDSTERSKTMLANLNSSQFNS